AVIGLNAKRQPGDGPIGRLERLRPGVVPVEIDTHTVPEMSPPLAQVLSLSRGSRQRHASRRNKGQEQTSHRDSPGFGGTGGGNARLLCSVSLHLHRHRTLGNPPCKHLNPAATTRTTRTSLSPWERARVTV